MSAKPPAITRTQSTSNVFDRLSIPKSTVPKVRKPEPTDEPFAKAGFNATAAKTSVVANRAKTLPSSRKPTVPPRSLTLKKPLSKTPQPAAAAKSAPSSPKHIDDDEKKTESPAPVIRAASFSAPIPQSQIADTINATTLNLLFEPKAKPSLEPGDLTPIFASPSDIDKRRFTEEEIQGVKFIDLSHTTITSEQLASLLKKFIHVTRIALSSNPALTDAGLYEVRNCKSLCYFSMRDCVGIRTLSFLADLPLEHLETFALSNPTLFIGNSAGLTKFANGALQLAEVDLSNCAGLRTSGLLCFKSTPSKSLKINVSGCPHIDKAAVDQLNENRQCPITVAPELDYKPKPPLTPRDASGPLPDPLAPILEQQRKQLAELESATRLQQELFETARKEREDQLKASKAKDDYHEAVVTTMAATFEEVVKTPRTPRVTSPENEDAHDLQSILSDYATRVRPDVFAAMQSALSAQTDRNHSSTQASDAIDRMLAATEPRSTPIIGSVLDSLTLNGLFTQNKPAIEPPKSKQKILGIDVDLDPIYASPTEIAEYPFTQEQIEGVKTLKLFRTTISDEQLIALLKRFTHIERVILSFDPTLTSVGLSGLKFLKNLRVLYVGNCPQILTLVFLKIVPLTSLEKFGFTSKVPIEPSDSLRALAKAPKLTYVSFYMSPNLTPDAFLCFQETLQQTSLEIDITGCDLIGPDTIEKLNSKRGMPLSITVQADEGQNSVLEEEEIPNPFLAPQPLEVGRTPPTPPPQPHQNPPPVPPFPMRNGASKKSSTLPAPLSARTPHTTQERPQSDPELTMPRRGSESHLNGSPKPLVSILRKTNGTNGSPHSDHSPAPTAPTPLTRVAVHTSPLDAQSRSASSLAMMQAKAALPLPVASSSSRAPTTQEFHLSPRSEDMTTPTSPFSDRKELTTPNSARRPRTPGSARVVFSDTDEVRQYSVEDGAVPIRKQFTPAALEMGAPSATRSGAAILDTPSLDDTEPVVPQTSEPPKPPIQAHVITVETLNQFFPESQPEEELIPSDIVPIHASPEQIADLPLAPKEIEEITELDLTNSAISDQQFVALIRQLRHLKVLKLIRNPNLTNEAFANTELPHLQSLTVQLCDQIDGTGLDCLVPWTPRLDEFNFTSPHSIEDSHFFKQLSLMRESGHPVQVVVSKQRSAPEIFRIQGDTINARTLTRIFIALQPKEAPTQPKKEPTQPKKKHRDLIPLHANPQQIANFPFTEEETEGVTILDLTDLAISDDQFIALIHRFPNLKVLILNRNPHLTNGAFRNIRLPLLESLTIRHCPQIDQNGLYHFAPQAPQLREFNFTSQHVIDNPLFFEQLSRSPNLNRLSLHLCENLDPKALLPLRKVPSAQAVMISLQGSPVAQSFIDTLNQGREKPFISALLDVDRADQYQIDLTQALAKTPPLPESSDVEKASKILSMQRIYDDLHLKTVPGSGTLLGHYGKLPEDSFQGIDWEGSILAYEEVLGAFVEKFQNIRWVRLYNSEGLSETGFASLRTLLPKCETLYIGGKKCPYQVGKCRNAISQRALEEVWLPTAEMIAKQELPWRHLKNVHLAGLAITNKTLEYLAELPIENLNISFCTNVSRVGVKQFIKMATLKKLSLVGCKWIDPLTLDELRKMRPDIQILADEWVIDPQLNALAMQDMTQVLQTSEFRYYTFAAELLEKEGKPIPVENFDLLRKFHNKDASITAFYKEKLRRFGIDFTHLSPHANVSLEDQWKRAEVFLQALMNIFYVLDGMATHLVEEDFFIYSGQRSAPTSRMQLFEYLNHSNNLVDNAQTLHEKIKISQKELVDYYLNGQDPKYQTPWRLKEWFETTAAQTVLSHLHLYKDPIKTQLLEYSKTYQYELPPRLLQLFESVASPSIIKHLEIQNDYTHRAQLNFIRNLGLTWLPLFIRQLKWDRAWISLEGNPLMGPLPETLRNHLPTVTDANLEERLLERYKSTQRILNDEQTLRKDLNISEADLRIRLHRLYKSMQRSHEGEEINLSGMPVTDRALRILSENHAQRRDFLLNYGQETDSHSINLASCPKITYKGLQYLIQDRSIQSLNLQGCTSLSPGDIAELKKHRPDVVVQADQKYDDFILEMAAKETVRHFQKAPAFGRYIFLADYLKKPGPIPQSSLNVSRGKEEQTVNEFWAAQLHAMHVDLSQLAIQGQIQRVDWPKIEFFFQTCQNMHRIAMALAKEHPDTPSIKTLLTSLYEQNETETLNLRNLGLTNLPPLFYETISWPRLKTVYLAGNALDELPKAFQQKAPQLIIDLHSEDPPLLPLPRPPEKPEEKKLNFFSKLFQRRKDKK